MNCYQTVYGLVQRHRLDPGHKPPLPRAVLGNAVFSDTSRLVIWRKHKCWETCTVGFMIVIGVIDCRSGHMDAGRRSQCPGSLGIIHSYK